MDGWMDGWVDGWMGGFGWIRMDSEIDTNDKDEADRDRQIDS